MRNPFSVNLSQHVRGYKESLFHTLHGVSICISGPEYGKFGHCRFLAVHFDWRDWEDDSLMKPLLRFVLQSVDKKGFARQHILALGGPAGWFNLKWRVREMWRNRKRRHTPFGEVDSEALDSYTRAFTAEELERIGVCEHGKPLGKCARCAVGGGEVGHA